MASAGRNPTDRTYLSIREVLDLLVDEFPDVTISKIRFLESRGLISPERTPSGYRKFYDPDVERLRWILRQQREHFLPLKVIKGRLENGNGHVSSEPVEASLFDAFVPESAPPPGNAFLPAQHGSGTHPSVASLIEAPALPVRVPALTGLSLAPALPRPSLREAPPKRAVEAVEAEIAPTVVESPATPEALAPSDEPGPEVTRPAVPTRSRGARRVAAGLLTAEELAAAADVEIALVAALEEYGLIEAKPSGGVSCFEEEAVALVRAASGFARFGIEARHLRTFKHAAEREAGLFSQVVTPLLLQRNPASRVRATEQLEELAALGAELQAALMRRATRELLGG